MAKKKRKPHRKHRAAFQIKGNAGLFDSRERDAKLTYLGDPLERINAEVPWEMFRADLQTLYVQRDGAVGRKPIDPVLMFKILILQRLYNLSDDQTEYQIRDRASFQRFLGLHLEDGSPDAKTIWLFKERIKTKQLSAVLFARFDAALIERGLIAKGGADRRCRDRAGTAPAKYARRKCAHQRR